MELVFYTTMSWLVTAYLITTIQSKEIIRSIITYFLYIILTVSVFTILSLNLELIHVTEDKTKFLSLLLSQHIILPFLVLIIVNWFYRLKSYMKIAPIILLMPIIILIEFINIKLQIYSYSRWNFSLSFIINLLFMLFALIVGKSINTVQPGGEITK